MLIPEITREENELCTTEMLHFHFYSKILSDFPKIWIGIGHYKIKAMGGVEANWAN